MRNQETIVNNTVCSARTAKQSNREPHRQSMSSVNLHIRQNTTLTQYSMSSVKCTKDKTMGNVPKISWTLQTSTTQLLAFALRCRSTPRSSPSSKHAAKFAIVVEARREVAIVVEARREVRHRRRSTPRSSPRQKALKHCIDDRCSQATSRLTPSSFGNTGYSLVG